MSEPREWLVYYLNGKPHVVESAKELAKQGRPFYPRKSVIEKSAYDQLLQRIAEKNKFIDEQRENVKTLLSDLTISRGNELMNEKRIAELERENEALHLAYNGLEDIHLKLEQEVARLEGDIQIAKLDKARAKSEEEFAYKVRDSYKAEIASLKLIAESQTTLVSRYRAALKEIAKYNWVRTDAVSRKYAEDIANAALAASAPNPGTHAPEIGTAKEGGKE